MLTPTSRFSLSQLLVVTPSGALTTASLPAPSKDKSGEERPGRFIDQLVRGIVRPVRQRPHPHLREILRQPVSYRVKGPRLDACQRVVLGEQLVGRVVAHRVNPVLRALHQR